jgi:hypothetical protein
MTPDHPYPAVTIAVPTYNRADLLGRALSSLSRQTYSDLEIVICDNASNDATTEIASAHMATDSRIRYHRSATNFGAFKNFELGLLLARGKYFMWAADDDLWEPVLVRKLVDALDADGSAALACAEARYMDISGNEFEYFPEGSALRKRPCRGSAGERLRALVNGHYGNLFYGLYRRDALVRTYRDRPVGTAFSIYGPTTVGVYGPQSGVNEVPILLQVAARGSINVLDECLWAKATTQTAYSDAKEERERRDGIAHPNRPALGTAGRARGATAIRWRLRSDAAYHRAVLADIASSIRTLDITYRLKRELLTRFQLRLLRHFANFERRQALAATQAMEDSA